MHYRTDKVVSLQDLLNALQDSPAEGISDAGTTVVKLSEFYAQPANDILLDLLPDDKESFRDYLKQHRYAKNSIRSYYQLLGRCERGIKGGSWFTRFAVRSRHVD